MCLRRKRIININLCNSFSKLPASRRKVQKLEDVFYLVMNQINRNFAQSPDFSEKSFISIFHEESKWDDEEYSKLEHELYRQSEKYSNCDCIPREVLWPTMRIFSYLMQSFSCQYDSDDIFEITNITREQFLDRRERVQLVFEGFFKGEMPNIKYLGY